jgi:NAD-dependent DNA ligase
VPQRNHSLFAYCLFAGRNHTKKMSLSGKTVVFTGALDIKRADAKSKAETAGARVTGSVSKVWIFPSPHADSFLR